MKVEVTAPVERDVTITLTEREADLLRELLGRTIISREHFMAELYERLNLMDLKPSGQRLVQVTTGLKVEEVRTW